MRNISAPEIFVLVSELKEKVVGKRVKNFYEIQKDSFEMVLEGSEHTTIYINLLRAICETKFREKQEKSNSATNFALSIRKFVNGAMIVRFAQHNGDRIVEIEMSNGTKLMIEMFPEGNLIVTNENYVIQDAYRKEEFKDRKIIPNQIYKFPKNSALPFGEIDEEHVDAAMREVEKSSTKLIVALAKYFNFGPMYLENVILHANLNPNAPASEIKNDEHALHALESGIEHFSGLLKSKEFVLYLKDGVPFDFSIMPIKKYAELEYQHFDSLGSLLDNAYVEERSKTIDKAKERKINELKSSVEKQVLLQKEMHEKSLKYREAGKKIFEHMHDVNLIIESMKKGKETVNESGKVKLKSIDKKNKTIKIEIED